MPEDALQYDIESAVLVDGVTSICDREFARCFGLKFVQIGRSVATIGDEAFAFCSKLKSIAIPDSLETIGNAAFAECKFFSIKIPKSVVSLGENPFPLCWDLEEIDVSENPNFIFVDGVLMNKEMTKIIHCDPSKLGDYSVPDTVSTICEGTFTECGKLTSIAIPDSVTSIGDEAFYECNRLRSITIPTLWCPLAAGHSETAVNWHRLKSLIR